MNLYKLTQDSETGYDTYDSCVVCAESEDDAKRIRPGRDPNSRWWEEDNRYSSWATSLGQVTVQFLGPASPTLTRGVICASFNAG